MSRMDVLDFLVVGGGPAGLAAAIRYRQKVPSASVVVIDKAREPGYHTLSGAVIEAGCLDQLLPGWREDVPAFMTEASLVDKDEMYFLTGAAAFRIPSCLVPPGMHHKRDHIVSLAVLVEWLGKKAVEAGVEVYTGLSAESLVWDNDKIVGVKLVDQGRDAAGKPKANFLAGERILARTTVLADGARGVLSREYIARTGGNRNPQVYSLGVKQLLQWPSGHALGPGRVIHTLGFPNRPDVFGGGFLYSMGRDMAAVGLILGLDWKYTDLDPQNELEIFKVHPFIAGLIRGGKVIGAGAKTIPEGGFFALPRLCGNGVFLVGDAAGFVNMEKIKGVHYAVFSGMAAADAASAGDPAVYMKGLEAFGVMRDMRHARNFRAVFQAGIFIGAPLSMVQSLWPWRIPMKHDHLHTRRGCRLDRAARAGLDRAGFAFLSGTRHREDEPPHLIIRDPGQCARCHREFESPCTFFCPVEVYRREAETIRISAANCIHCGTCALKCPLENIHWIPPEGGEGPRYKLM